MTTLELQANRQSLNQLRPYASISDMREAIERSEKDISLGHLSSHEDVMNRIHTKIAIK